MATPSAQLVGNAFVEQYYQILHNSPDEVYRFYQDISVLSRPDSNGVMTPVTSMEGINEKILSFDYKNYKAEIRTADAQMSHKEGVALLVTGCLTDKDNIRRKFAQSFFLAPQDTGYFVLNDVFRYVEDDHSLEKPSADGMNNTAQVSNPEPGSTYVPEPHVSNEVGSVAEDKNVVGESADVPIREIHIANAKESVVESQPHPDRNDATAVTEAAASAQEDAPKKSYASIVKVVKGISVPTKVYVPTNTSKVSPKKSESQPHGSQALTPVNEAPNQNGNEEGPESRNTHDEGEGYSVYIGNLPFSVTMEQLEMEFKKFGPIKKEGIQIRNNKQQGYCFGFVEFLSSSAMNDAIKASPITMSGRQATVEAKRASGRGEGDRGRFPPGRGGYRNENFRGRGNYGGGRSFRRNEYNNNWSESSGRGRGPPRQGESYQQGRGRGRTNQDAQ